MGRQLGQGHNRKGIGCHPCLEERQLLSPLLEMMDPITEAHPKAVAFAGIDAVGRTRALVGDHRQRDEFHLRVVLVDAVIVLEHAVAEPRAGFALDFDVDQQPEFLPLATAHPHQPISPALAKRSVAGDLLQLRIEKFVGFVPGNERVDIGKEQLHEGLKVGADRFFPRRIVVGLRSVGGVAHGWSIDRLMGGGPRSSFRPASGRRALEVEALGDFRGNLTTSSCTTGQDGEVGGTRGAVPHSLSLYYKDVVMLDFKT